MPQIANVSYNPLNFTEKDGTVVEILPGEAKPVDIDKDNINVTARENARLIVVGGTEAQAKKVAREAPAANLAPVKAGEV